MIVAASSKRGSSIGEDAEIGKASGNASLQRAFRHIALASASLTGNDPASGAQLAQQGQELLQRFGRMGVVDDDREWLPLVDSLHATGNLRSTGQSCRDRL